MGRVDVEALGLLGPCLADELVWGEPSQRF